MSFPHDRTSIGDFVMQHHDPSGTWGAEQGSRRRQGRCRFVGFDKTTGAAIFDRIGWDHGGACWLSTGAGSNLMVPVWSYAFPALVDPTPQTQSGPGYASKVQGPLAKPALKQLVDPTGKTWMADAGLLAQPGALPVGLDLPEGYPVLAVPMSTLDEQQMALIPAGGLLVAVYNGGFAKGQFGSKVFDVDVAGRLDLKRWARLQSHMHVYMLPQVSPVGFIFGGNAFSKVPTGAAPGGLAWMLGPDIDGQGGHGVVCDTPSVAGAPAISETPPLVTQDYYQRDNLGNVIGKVSGAPLAGTGLTQDKGNGITAFGKAGQSATQEKLIGNGAPTTVGSGPAILAVSSYRGRGPLNVGQASDPHQLATTPDGKIVNALHEDEGAIVIGDTGDAPRKNDKNGWQPVRPDGPFWNEAYRRNDLNDVHTFFGKTVKGLRKIQTSEYMDVPHPNGERPGVPGNPPPPPPPIYPGPLPGPEFPGPNGPKGPKPPKGGGFIPQGPNPPGPGPDPPTPPTPPDAPPSGPDIPPGGYFYGQDGQRVIYDDNGNEVHIYNGPQDGGGGGGGGPGPSDGPVAPVNPGGATDAPPQKSFPAMGLALGVNDILGRAAPIQDNITDPRYQFGAYTDQERDIYDNTPVAVRLSTFQDQTGGGTSLLGPKCGPSGLTTGITSHGGFAITPSGYDLPEKLRGIDQPLNPANRAYLNFETPQSFESFGDVGVNGLPANGFRTGRTFEDGIAKSMDIVETDEDGLEFETPAFSLDFLTQKLRLWGVEVPMTGGAGGGGTTDGWWGDGSDGAAVLNGGAAPTGMTFDGAITYHMTRDVFYTNLTMSGVYRLETDGWRLFVNGTLTIGASNRVSGDGNAAINFTNGGTKARNTLGGGSSGNTGFSRTTAGTDNGLAGIANSSSFGGQGGTGGASGTGLGGHGSGGAGGTITRPASNFGELREMPQMALALLESYQGAVPLEGGSGGGAGGTEFNAADAGATLYSGGGGGGAGVVLILAKILVNNGVISAQGGAGGLATFTGVGSLIASGAGGGGGGGGGLVVVVYGSSGSTIGTLTVAGGGGGGAVGSTAGTAGATGSTGRTRTLALDTSGGGGGTLAGDVTGTTAASVVSFVGGVAAATVVADLPSAGQKAALVGTSGTPGAGNKYCTDADLRLSFASSALQPGTATILTSTVAPSSTANVTLDATANIWPCNTGSAFTATLPDATTCSGRHYWIKKTSADSNVLTVAATGLQTIDGSSSIAISVQWTTIHVVSDGANWLII